MERASKSFVNASVCQNLLHYSILLPRAQNYNASLKLRPTLVKVTNFDTILYR